jgi:hypothetical protein
MYEQYYKMIQNDERCIKCIEISGSHHENVAATEIFFWVGRRTRTFSHKVTFMLFKNISVDHPLYPG